MIICPICETENESHEEHCILCGTPLEHEKPKVFPNTVSFNNEVEDALDELLPMPDNVSVPQEHITPSSAALPLNLPTTSPTQNNTNPLSSPSQSSPIPPQSSPTPPQDPQHIPLYADSVDMHENSTGPQISLRMTTSTPTFEPHPHAPIPSTFDHPLQSPPSSFTQPNIQDIPPTGTLCLIIYFQRKPALYFPIAYDEVLIGRTDPASNAYPDLDLTPFDPDLAISRKHTYIYREQDRYYIYPISNSGTQVNQEMVDIGTKRQLVEGDVLILSGRLAIRFART